MPAYAYVPGRFPHPISDPQGHSYGLAPLPADAPDPQQWRSCRPYVRGLDLFNHGFYWEAHEAWESLWHACGRSGTAASFFKGLIKLAAAGVKARQGVEEGVRGHARRAAELFRKTESALGGEHQRYMGLSLAELTDYAEELETRPIVTRCPSVAPVEIVFSFILRPE